MTNALASKDLVDVPVDEMEDISEPEPLTDDAWHSFANWLKNAPSPGTDAQSRNITALTNPIFWLSDALEDVAQVAALPLDWDGHGSPQLGENEREYAVDILASLNYEALPIPAPVIVPVSGGGIQIEWHHAGRELELEIVAGSESLLFLKVYEDEVTEEGCYPIADRNKTQELLDWLIAG